VVNSLVRLLGLLRLRCERGEQRHSLQICISNTAQTHPVSYYLSILRAISSSDYRADPKRLILLDLAAPLKDRISAAIMIGLKPYSCLHICLFQPSSLSSTQTGVVIGSLFRRHSIARTSQRTTVTLAVSYLHSGFSVLTTTSSLSLFAALHRVFLNTPTSVLSRYVGSLDHASGAWSLCSHIKMHQDPISFLSPSSSLVSGGCSRIGHIARYD